MDLGGEMPNTVEKKSLGNELLRYIQHGLGLGVILICSLFVLLVLVGTSYSFLFVLFGTPLLGAISYAIVFEVVGGANFVLADHIWGIKCEQNIATGMRDGFFIFICSAIVFFPLNMLFNSTIYMPWFAPTPLQVLLIFFLSIPIFIILSGVIGKSVAVFLYVDKEPAMPTDFVEHSYVCPHCGSQYYYRQDTISEGMVICQNCAQQFSIS